MPALQSPSRGKKTMLMAALHTNPARENTSRPRRWWLFLGGILGVALLSLAAARRIQQRSEGGRETVPEESVPSVSVVRAAPVTEATVTLPATLRANQATDLYPRVNGFVKSWKVEIGARVRAGQLVAAIDAPELDQEVERAEAQAKQAAADLEQARAELDEAKSEVDLSKANLDRSRANLEFAARQAQRDRRLVSSRTVAQEEYERTASLRDTRSAEVTASEADVKRRQSALGTRTASVRSREATLANQQANVRRLRELQGFKRIVAPFDGVVANRNAEVGLLVTAGSTSSTRPLYRVVQTDVLRAQLPVPQAFAAQVREGDPASVAVPEHPGKDFPARVARTAGEIDPVTRTVLVELELPNREGLLLPGTYAQVKIAGKRADRATIIPAAAVLLRTEGSMVAVVRHGEVRLRKVELGRDHGNRVEVLSGLTAGEELVANPTDDLRDGSKVEVQNAGSGSLVRR